MECLHIIRRITLLQRAFAKRATELNTVLIGLNDVVLRRGDVSSVARRRSDRPASAS